MGIFACAVHGIEVNERSAGDNYLCRTVFPSCVDAVDKVLIAVFCVAVRFACKEAAVDNESSFLNLNSSTAAIIVASVDGKRCAFTNVDAVTAVYAGVDSAFFGRVDSVSASTISAQKLVLLFPISLGEISFL